MSIYFIVPIRSLSTTSDTIRSHLTFICDNMPYELQKLCFVRHWLLTSSLWHWPVQLICYQACKRAISCGDDLRTLDKSFFPPAIFSGFGIEKSGWGLGLVNMENETLLRRVTHSIWTRRCGINEIKMFTKSGCKICDEASVLTFHSSGGIPSMPRALPFLILLTASAISFSVGISWSLSTSRSC